MALTLISFILVMSVLVFVHEAGHFVFAKRSDIIVEEFGFGFPPRLLKLGERGGTVYSLNAIPFGGYVRMRGEDDPKEIGSFAAAPKLARTATLLAGPAMNLLLAILMFSILGLLTGVPDPDAPGAVVVSVAPGSPAALAGIANGDRIVAVDVSPVRSPSDLQADASQRVGRETNFTVIRRDSSGQSQTLQFRMVPRVSPPPNEGALGIGIASATRPATVWLAAAQGATTTWQVVILTFQIPVTLLREGKPISDAGFMGPVGIAITTGEVVRSAIDISSMRPILWFMGLLSTALAITNLLPIPGLDGGRLLFVLLEAIRRRRVEPAHEGIVHLVGFGLLLVLVGLLTVKEITSLINGTFPALAIR